jgi:hypothetical protein
MLALSTVLWCSIWQATPQQTVEDGVDRVLLLDRSEVCGEITGYEASGRLRIKDKDGGRTLELPIEDLAQLRFGPEEGLIRPSEPVDQVRLFHGGWVTGRILSFDGTTVMIESPAGKFHFRREDIKALFLGSLVAPSPDIRNESKDVLIREVEEGREKPVRQAVAEYGRLLSMGEKTVFRVMSSAGAEEREFDRASVKQIILHREGGSPDIPPGLFSKVMLKNGDRLVGVLRSFSRDKVRFFSHLFGSVEIEKRKIRSITFVQRARMAAGNILICSQEGVRELDREGNEAWSFHHASNAWSARKLENGNVLIANTHSNQVVEVKPAMKTGGEVVWRIDNVVYPSDAVRLENGNTLVVECHANRVVEYDGRTQTIVWQVKMSYPMAAQRLENGNTLISTNVQVVEVDRQGREQWRAELGAVCPWRVQRLENGNTLITDYQNGLVVELDPRSRVVWKLAGLSKPVQAIRLEDGNTLILEQEKNRLIEVDPTSPKPLGIVKEVAGIQSPLGMSIH